MKKLVIAVVAVALIAVAAIALRGNKSEDTNTATTNTETTAPVESTEPTDTSQAETGTTVTYDGKSFSPINLKVKAGTTVTWKSSSTAPMWVATDPHPAHTEYSGFDAKKSTNEYSFKFDKTGSWSYHNHLNPSAQGTIVVE